MYRKIRNKIVEHLWVLNQKHNLQPRGRGNFCVWKILSFPKLSDHLPAKQPRDTARERTEENKKDSEQKKRAKQVERTNSVVVSFPRISVDITARSHHKSYCDTMTISWMMHRAVELSKLCDVVRPRDARLATQRASWHAKLTKGTELKERLTSSGSEKRREHVFLRKEGKGRKRTRGRKRKKKKKKRKKDREKRKPAEME